MEKKDNNILARATGRRKEAVAQVIIKKGTGQFLINNKPAQVYLQNNSSCVLAIKAPFETLQSFQSNEFNVKKTSGPAGSDGQLLSTRSTLSASGLVDLKVAGVSQLQSSFSPPPGENKPVGQAPPAKGPGVLSGKAGSKGISSSQTNSVFTENSNNDISIDKNPLFFDPLKVDTLVKVCGGGLVGQAEAIKLGVARAICILNNVEPLFGNLPVLETTLGQSSGSAAIASPSGISGISGKGQRIGPPERQKEFSNQISSGDNNVQTDELKTKLVNLNMGVKLKKALKSQGLLTQDSRVKERRKYGLKKARKASQYHKR
jgi:ribosomal protein S9